MRKLRDILRLGLEAKLSIRQIHASTRISVGAIQNLLAQAKEKDLSWADIDEMDDNQLTARFYPEAKKASSRFHIPDWAEMHQELKRKGMTRQLYWEEYCRDYPNHCYSYPQFTERYRQWLKKQKRSMRQTHKAGEKCFVDYCGPRVPIISATTGEIREAQVFVGVLGASNYTFAEATWSQSLPNWLGSHTRMLDFFAGSPEMIVPDNLRSGVSKACRYDPDLNPSYQQWAEHYQVAVVPARPYKPKDKAKAEVGVQIVERWIMAKLRHYTFFSLAELNRCIATLLTELNQKPFQKLPGNRQQAFETLDKPVLRPLPRNPYQYIEIKTVKVNIDYHVQFNQHHYSVPHQYVGEKLELHASEQLVSCYFRQQLIASHARKHQPGTTTEAAHMPQSHEKHHKWSPERLKNWARNIGPEVLIWVTSQLETKKHPEQAYRVCLGLLNLDKQFPGQLNNACQIANQEGLKKLKQIKSILSSKRDQLPQQLNLDMDLPQDHENIRGAEHYH